MSVIPGDKICRPITALESDPGQIQLLIRNRTSRENHRVIVLLQIFESDVFAIGDVAKKPDLPGIQHLTQGRDNSFNTWVIRCHPVSNEPIGSGKTLEKVNGDIKGPLVLEQDIGGINSGRAGADNG